jgi:hypothetical protein
MSSLDNNHLKIIKIFELDSNLINNKKYDYVSYILE